MIKKSWATVLRSNFHNEHVMQFYRNNLKIKGVF